MRTVTVAGLMAVLGLSAGCGGEQHAAQLSIRQVGWDSLHLDVAFAERTTFGKAQAAEPQRLTTMVFRANYDTLYAGPALGIAVPDAELGDRENLMVEVCAYFEEAEVCEQGAVQASPKRVVAEQDISYPEDSDFEEGTYDVRFVVERQRFGGDGWERIDRRKGVEGYMMAYVEDVEGGAVRVPIARSRGRFNLARYAGYDDFYFYLKSKLLDEREARVRFDVYGGLDGQASPLASVEKEVRKKTPAERAAEVQYFVEQAVEQLLDRLHAFGRAHAYIDEWEFDPFTGTYEVALEVGWRTSFSGRDRYELIGTLEVREDGTGGQLKAERGNRRLRRHWRDRFDDDTLRLERLQTLREREAEQAAEQEALSIVGAP